MRMCGMVKCRPTLAYRVYFDGINISDRTDYKILLQREIGSNAVLILDQRLRRWPTLNQHLEECALLAGKALTVNMLEVNCFQNPMVTQPFVSQHKAHIRELVNYFLIDVAQVYRVYMICELALNAAMYEMHAVLLSWLINVHVG